MAGNMTLRRDKGIELTHDEMDNNFDFVDKKGWFTKTSPTQNDDTTKGFAVDNIWINVLLNKMFKCVDATATLAVWEEIPLGSGANTFIDLTDTPASFVANKYLRVDATGSAVILVDIPTWGNLLSDGSVDMDAGYVPLNALSIATKAYIDTIISNLPTAGNLLSDGSVDMDLGYTPVNSLAIVTKSYVDVLAFSLADIGASGTTASRPSSPKKGQYYWDETLGIPIWYNGVNWTNHLGTTV